MIGKCIGANRMRRPPKVEPFTNFIACPITSAILLRPRLSSRFKRSRSSLLDYICPVERPPASIANPYCRWQVRRIALEAAKIAIRARGDFVDKAPAAEAAAKKNKPKNFLSAFTTARRVSRGNDS